MSDKLKNCPVCGKKPTSTKTSFVLGCMHCRVRPILIGEKPDVAIEAWNKRHDEKESIHWHKHHHPKCQDCKHGDDRVMGIACSEIWDIDIIFPKDFYCAKYEEKNHD